MGSTEFAGVCRRIETERNTRRHTRKSFRPPLPCLNFLYTPSWCLRFNGGGSNDFRLRVAQRALRRESVNHWLVDPYDILGGCWVCVGELRPREARVFSLEQALRLQAVPKKYRSCTHRIVIQGNKLSWTLDVGVYLLDATTSSASAMTHWTK